VADAATPHAPEPPIDVRSAAQALRRSAPLIAVVTAIVTAVTLMTSLVAPERYRATARIAEDPAAAATSDPATLDRRLATSRELVTSPTVLAAAAERLDGETAGSLAGKVSTELHPGSGLLDVVATGDDADAAARTANTVAEQFLAESERLRKEQLTQTTERIADELARLRDGGSDLATGALRERLGEISVDEVTRGSGLELAEPATPPSGPYAPRPLRSTLLALFVALFGGLLIALARDRLRPRPPDAPTLSELLELPLLAALPEPAGGPLRLRSQRPADDHAVVETAVLQAAIRVALPPRTRRVVLVLGVGRAHGGARVAADLTRSLCWAGHGAVLVSRDPVADDVPAVRSVDGLDGDADHIRYAIVDGPPITHGTALQTLAPAVSAVIVVMRLGSASTTDAIAARRLLGALGLKGLGLVVTGSKSQVGGVPPEAFAFPTGPAPRPRSSSRNGAAADKRPSTAGGHDRPLTPS
jgi:capsular polysaccharide biosynthesis protein